MVMYNYALHLCAMNKKFELIVVKKLLSDKIFYHKQFYTKISNGEFFPNYGMQCEVTTIQ